MTNKDVARIESALASVEKILEDIGDERGFGAATLRLVIDAIGTEIQADRQRGFNRGAFELNCMPISHERMRQAILKSYRGTF